MRPLDFPEANITLKAPDVDNIEILDLRVWSDSHQCVSLWKPTLRERLSILLFGRVWLALLSGSSQPPAYISGHRTYFIPREEMVRQSPVRFVVEDDALGDQKQ